MVSKGPTVEECAEAGVDLEAASVAFECAIELAMFAETISRKYDFETITAAQILTLVASSKSAEMTRSESEWERGKVLGEFLCGYLDTAVAEVLQKAGQ